MRYILAPYLRIAIHRNVMGYGFGSLFKKITDKELQKKILDVSEFWLEPNSIQEARNHFSKDYLEAIEIIETGNYLIEYSPKKDSRYSRNHLYFSLSGGNPYNIQRKIESSHIIILGCGGIGNLVSAALAGYGIGKLTLVDQDVIEESNLTRQFLFSEKDLGKEKISILKKELLSKNSSLNIDCLNLKINSYEDLFQLPKSDLIVLSADNPFNIVYLVNKFSINKKIPFINIGYVEDIAVWGPFIIPEKTGCYECKNIVLKNNESNGIIKKVNSRYQAPSSPTTNMLAASFGINDIIKYIGNFGNIHSLNKKISYRSYDHTFFEDECIKSDDCPLCSRSLY